MPKDCFFIDYSPFQGIFSLPARLEKVVLVVASCGSCFLDQIAHQYQHSSFLLHLMMFDSCCYRYYDELEAEIRLYWLISFFGTLGTQIYPASVAFKSTFS